MIKDKTPFFAYWVFFEINPNSPPLKEEELGRISHWTEYVNLVSVLPA